MDYIVVELKKRGIKYFRLNTEDLPRSYCSMSDSSFMDWSISINGNTIKGIDVKAAYFRRPGNPEVPASITDPGIADYIQGEWIVSLRVFIRDLILFGFARLLI